MVFKFQSDSINTILAVQGSDEEYYFKFQSDSINTQMQKILPVSGVALNSNLILLIPGTDGKGIDTYAAVFKFQSDSINTNRAMLKSAFKSL